jgi:aryl-alcohol dehydrogenase-like predicted oxidoreductase
MRSPDDFAPDDRRRLFPRFQGDNFDKNLQLVDAIAHLAGRRGVKASQLALAWVLSRGEDVVPVFGTRRRGHLDENLEAQDLRLSESELAELERIAPPGAAAGERYPDMSLVNR